MPVEEGAGVHLAGGEVLEEQPRVGLDAVQGAALGDQVRHPGRAAPAVHADAVHGAHGEVEVAFAVGGEQDLHGAFGEFVVAVQEHQVRRPGDLQGAVARALHPPLFSGSRRYTIRGSWAASSRATSSVASVEWSSLITTSMLAWVWRSTDATARGGVRRRCRR